MKDGVPRIYYKFKGATIAVYPERIEYFLNELLRPLSAETLKALDDKDALNNALSIQQVD